MTPKEAYEVLREFQMWRRDEGKYSEIPKALPYSTKTVGIALDVAIETRKQCNQKAKVNNVIEYHDDRNHNWCNHFLPMGGHFYYLAYKFKFIH